VEQIFVQATGASLREERLAAGAKVFEVAIRMNVHSSRVSQIEALATVTPETIERYRKALDEWKANA
jgi:transcriptional regulator with XRE-family HTH domain